MVRCHANYAKQAALAAYLETNPDDRGATLLRQTKGPHGRM